LLTPLINGKSDAFLGNLDVTLYKLRSQKGYEKYTDNISYLPKPIENKRGAFFVLSKKSKLRDKNELARKITENLIKMEKDGTYSKISSRYMNKFAIYQTGKN